MKRDSYNKIHVSQHQLENNFLPTFEVVHFDLLSYCRYRDNIRKLKKINTLNNLGLALVPFSVFSSTAVFLGGGGQGSTQYSI